MVLCRGRGSRIDYVVKRHPDAVQSSTGYLKCEDAGHDVMKLETDLKDLKDKRRRILYSEANRPAEGIILAF
jgi:hypothetical protein